MDQVCENDEANCRPSFDHRDADDQCSIYLAVSSVRNAGLGLFTTRSIEEGDAVFPRSNGPAIVLSDIGLFGEEFHDHADWRDRFGMGTLYDYLWGGSHMAGFESFSRHTEVYATGYGLLFNHHSFLKNVEESSSYEFYGHDDSLADRMKDPGAGAFTSYYTYDFTATRDIDRGEELFVEYADYWIESRGIPGVPQYTAGQNILNHLNDLGNIDGSIIRTVTNIVAELDELVASTLPKTEDEYKALMRSPRNLGVTSVVNRSVAWIESNGRCLDNLVARRSTVPHAGRGAFASRFLPRGTVVSPIVLIQIMEREALRMHDVSWNGRFRGWEKDAAVPRGEQLLVNYCFGSDYNPSLLLCGTGGSGSLVNHCSDRQDWGGSCGKYGGPNAALRWSSGWDPNTAEWLNFTLEDLADATASAMRGLSFDVVATRDIGAGEEVFFDYGVAWEKAWEDHVLQWKPPVDGSGFEYSGSAYELNQEERVRTLEEQHERPYPPHIVTTCQYGSDASFRKMTAEELVSASKALSDLTLDQILESFSDDGSFYNRPEAKYDAHFTCDIFDRKEESGSYTVHIHLLLESEDGGGEEEPVILTNYPRRAIWFATRAGMSDQYLPMAFRFPVGIPDNMFPQLWRI